jgi:hypothetical protein
VSYWMKFAGMGKSIGFALGKYIGNIGKKEKRIYQNSMLEKQDKLDSELWQKVKDGIKGFSDEQFEDLAGFINEEVCTGERKYLDVRHEVYSKLKHDMISYQYEKVLRKIRP